MRRRAPHWILVAFVALLVGLAAPAQAQTQAPAPPIPAELDPVLELVSPLLSPECSNVALALVIVPALVGGLPLDLGPLIGPVFTVCASVPIPDAATKLECAIDDQVLGAVSTVTVLALAIPPPVTTRVVGPLLEVLTNLQVALGLPPMLPAVLGDALACRPLNDPAPEPTPPTTVPASADPSTGAVTGGSGGGGPTAPSGGGSGIGSAGELPPLAQPGSGGAGTPTATERLLPVSNPVTGFAYPAVLIVPLLLLAVGGSFARSLTAEVRLPPR